MTRIYPQQNIYMLSDDVTAYRPAQGSTLAHVVAYNDASNQVNVFATREGYEATPNWIDVSGNINALLTDDDPTPLDIVTFQRGGRYPFSIYLSTREDGENCDVFWCQNPFGGAPSWTRLSGLLPAGLEFQPSTGVIARRPKPQPNPTGEVVVQAKSDTSGFKRYAVTFQDGNLLYSTFSCSDILFRASWINETNVIGYARSSGVAHLLSVPKDENLSHLTTTDEQLVSGYAVCGVTDVGTWHPDTLSGGAASAWPNFGYILPKSGLLYIATAGDVCSTSYLAKDEAGNNLDPTDVVSGASGAEWETTAYGLISSKPQQMALRVNPGAATFRYYLTQDGWATNATRIEMPEDGTPKMGIGMTKDIFTILYDTGSQIKIAEYSIASSAWRDITGTFSETTAQDIQGKAIDTYERF